MNAVSPHICAIIARQELRVSLRNRWIFVYAAIFTVLTSAVSYFGLSIIEFTGFQGFERTTASLLNLVLYIVPLAAMLMTVQSFTADGGCTDQLFTEPITRTEIVTGKLIGVSCALALATLLGFGLPGVIIARETGTAGLSSYLILVAYSLAIAAAFCSIAALLVITMQRTQRSYGVVLIAWFIMVLLYDLGIIGLSFMLPEGIANRVSYISLFLNPVDAARISTLLATVGKEMFGAAGVLLVRSLGGVGEALALLGAALLAWIVLPGSAASLLLKRQDI
jgi:Cu-processing system permease protein